MISLSYIPKPPLSHFIQTFWYYDGHSYGHDKERVLPDGSMELVINLAEDRLRTYDSADPGLIHTHRGCLLVGPRTEYFVIDTAAQVSVMGVHFKPGGAYPFLDCPSSEAQNKNVSLELLWGNRSNEMWERIVEAETPSNRFNVLEEMLLAKVTQPLQRTPAVVGGILHIQQAEPMLSMKALSAELGYSSRRFIELFKQEVGMTPKRFSRLNRFQKAVDLLDKHDAALDWSQLALSCGYFDQAHFNHDFRSFSGLTPSRFVNQVGERRNHIPL